MTTNYKTPTVQEQINLGLDLLLEQECDTAEKMITFMRPYKFMSQGKRFTMRTVWDVTMAYRLGQGQPITAEQTQTPEPEEYTPKKRGRPAGSKNKQK